MTFEEQEPGPESDTTDRPGNGTADFRRYADAAWLVPSLLLLAGLWIAYIKLADRETIKLLEASGAVFSALLVALIVGFVVRVFARRIAHWKPRTWAWLYISSTMWLLISIFFVPPRGTVGPVVTIPTSAPSAEPSPSGAVKDDNVNLYFHNAASSGKVRIGINGCLIGWSYNPDTERTGCGKIDTTNLHGFDIEVANFLAKKFGFTPEFVPLTQEERLWAISGANNTPKVSLVISVFSISPERRKFVDFAGPYYYDVTNIWRNLNKPESTRDDQVVYGCAVKGTRSYEKMTEMQNNSGPFNHIGRFEIDESASHLGDCIRDYEDPGKPLLQYIGSDWSILNAFYRSPRVVLNNDPNHVLTDAKVKPVNNELKEQYGVALEKNHPNVCKALSAAIEEFLTGESSIGISWLSAYNSWLEPRGLPRSWHKPDNVDASNCDGS